MAVRGRILIVEASMSSQGRVIRGRSIQLCYLEGLRRHLYSIGRPILKVSWVRIRPQESAHMYLPI